VLLLVLLLVLLFFLSHPVPKHRRNELVKIELWGNDGTRAAPPPTSVAVVIYSRLLCIYINMVKASRKGRCVLGSGSASGPTQTKLVRTLSITIPRCTPPRSLPSGPQPYTDGAGSDHGPLDIERQPALTL
jgi:hypothetical protein